MKRIALLLLAVGSLFVFDGCRKTGPQGPAGKDGNANVIGEDPFSVTTWTYTTNATGSGDMAYYADFSDPNITSSVASFGLVVVYIRYPDGTWKNLPDILNGTTFSYAVKSGGFSLYFSNVDGTTPVYPGAQTFRVVVVPSSYKQAHPNTDWKNYEEVSRLLGNGAASSAAGTVSGVNVQ